MGRGREKAKQEKAARRWDSVAVPDLLGLTAPEAERIGAELGLRVTAPGDDPEPVEELSGTVVRQHPAAGVLVARGSRVIVSTTGSGGEAGAHEPRWPFPPVPEGHTVLEPDADRAF
ncbi:MULTISPECIES: PASTA domain-containing protein [Actinoalloteichus]|uniref:PASTA domain-containing protein n=1 Tax=Actinoalloteichus fjordicus TaxID=1612552 RepID=A0AAC9LDV8_9PSEU|nr:MULTISPECIES: PASTA domain-containing protein [Actinoalloteichus]APU15030.1 PASTA domain-containing protein [Actinoalloteichus fjordicus]APU21098.1 PASTA domain-containing protein [Actinoalloteichus sp. GBA129-24]